MKSESELLYYFKPYIFFIAGFMCGQLEHPIKWISVVLFLSASLTIEWWRYSNRNTNYQEIEIKGIADT